jgi:subtilisin family serine protease
MVVVETHGTHVAGTILAANNSVGVLGVAYSANLYHARVLGPWGGTAENVMDGVRWLARPPAAGGQPCLGASLRRPKRTLSEMAKAVDVARPAMQCGFLIIRLLTLPTSLSVRWM